MEWIETSLCDVDRTGVATRQEDTRHIICVSYFEAGKNLGEYLGRPLSISPPRSLTLRFLLASLLEVA